jgi:hypothetical protein
MYSPLKKFINYWDNIHEHRPEMTNSVANTETLSNIKATAPFIVKLQIPITSQVQTTTMMIYDRKRALMWQLYPRSASEGGDGNLIRIAEIYRSRGYLGSKIYAWAKKLSEEDLSVCIKPLPSQDISW